MNDNIFIWQYEVLSISCQRIELKIQQMAMVEGGQIGRVGRQVFGTNGVLSFVFRKVEGPGWVLWCFFGGTACQDENALYFLRERWEEEEKGWS